MDQPCFNCYMNQISFQIPLRPISLNKSHRIVKFGKRPARIKTEEAKLFEEEFSYYLSQYEDLKPHLLSTYDERKHSIELEAFFYLNEDEYFTKPKKGFKTINKRCMDLDNMLKVANDQIFKWIGIDDSQLTKLHSQKIPTNDQATMVFRISLIPIPELFVVQPTEV